MTDAISFAVTTREGEQKIVTQGAGHQTLMQVLYEEDLGVEAICGGCTSCATCHVYIDPSWMSKLPERASSPPSIQSRTRCSCQTGSRNSKKLSGHKAMRW